MSQNGFEQQKNLKNENGILTSFILSVDLFQNFFDKGDEFDRKFKL